MDHGDRRHPRGRFGRLRHESRQLEDPIVTRLIAKKPLSLGELTVKEDCGLELLPQKFETHTNALVQAVTESNMLSTKALSSNIDTLYQYWHATRNLPEDHPLSQMGSQIATFEGFIKRYCPVLNGEQVRTVSKHFGYFTDVSIHPRRFLYFIGRDTSDREEIYDYQGDWVKLPSSLAGDTEYVERGVIKEAAAIEKDFSVFNYYHHASGSSVLDSVASLGKFISADKAKKLGVPIVTGYTSGRTQSEDDTHLSSVYFAPVWSPDYSTVRYFGEYPAFFAAQRGKVKKFMQEKGLWRGNMEASIASTGELLVGSEFPLELVDLMHTDYLSVPKMQAWASNHAPNARVISTEAMELHGRAMGSHVSKIDLTALHSQPGIHLT